MARVGFRVEWIATEVDAPHMLVRNGTGPAATAAHTLYTLEPEDGGTRFTYENEFTLPAGGVGKVAGRAVYGQAERQLKKSLKGPEGAGGGLAVAGIPGLANSTTTPDGKLGFDRHGTTCLDHPRPRGLLARARPGVEAALQVDPGFGENGVARVLGRPGSDESGYSPEVVAAEPSGGSIFISGSGVLRSLEPGGRPRRGCG